MVSLPHFTDLFNHWSSTVLLISWLQKVKSYLFLNDILFLTLMLITQWRLCSRYKVLRLLYRIVMSGIVCIDKLLSYTSLTISKSSSIMSSFYRNAKTALWISQRYLLLRLYWFSFAKKTRFLCTRLEIRLCLLPIILTSKLGHIFWPWKCENSYQYPSSIHFRASMHVKSQLTYNIE